MDRIVVYGKDWRRARSGSWWTEPLDLFSRHEVGIISLHTLHSHHVGKLSFQNTGVRRSTIGNEKWGLHNWLWSRMLQRRGWKFWGWEFGGSNQLLGTETQCSGVLHDGWWRSNHIETMRFGELWRLQPWEFRLFCHFNFIAIFGIFNSFYSLNVRTISALSF